MRGQGVEVSGLGVDIMCKEKGVIGRSKWVRVDVRGKGVRGRIRNKEADVRG